jgi:SAM-dependent methyltransferase
MEHSIERQAKVLASTSAQQHPTVTLPPNISEILCRDPRLIGFIAARHKFVAKILAGLDVLEIGCQEGFGTLFVAPYVRSITCIDFYPPFKQGFAKFSAPHLKNANFMLHDFTKGPVRGPFDGAFALDVLEHIDPSAEPQFWKSMCGSLATTGTAIIGMPSIESQAHASAASKAGHVNCKSGNEFRESALRYFTNVVIFSMNDEIIHNGFFPMSHYLLAICNGKR